jgi:predicted metalloprotease
MTFRRNARLNPGQVRDLRGSGGGLAIGGGLGGIVLLVAVLLLGGDPSQIPSELLGDGTRVGTGDNTEIEQKCQTGQDANTKEDCRIVGFVNSVQDFWQERLDGYQLAPTTFFKGGVNTGCGQASSAVGPFYCPPDKGVYIDLGFFDQLQSRFGAEGGPLAEGYVIAHEYGHHVQNLLGVLQPGGDTGAESRAVRTELQADCFAGAWANHAEEEFLEPLTEEQINQALDAAAAVGDDRIQEQTQGRVDRDSWTHGSSEQRQQWFKIGWQSGDPNDCDTFNADL